MASAARTSVVPPEQLQSFQEHLSKSTRILALLGAGLSASSGLPTFRGAGGLWRTHEATQLATPEAFERDPGLVWQFYSYRRHMALKAKPNPAHYALADLARKRESFITLSQNVDGTFTLPIQPTIVTDHIQAFHHARIIQRHNSSSSMAPYLTSSAQSSSATTSNATTTLTLLCLPSQSRPTSPTPRPQQR